MKRREFITLLGGAAADVARANAKATAIILIIVSLPSDVCSTVAS